jgi:hypothetical protein
MWLAQRWQQYWFAPGGRLSLAILRIAIAIAVWRSLDTMAHTWVENASYRPVGLWMLAGDSAPSSTIVDALWILARLSTITMALGLLSRTSTALSFLSTALLAGLYYSAMPTWSHAYNVVLLAQLAIIFGRSGDTFAVDALIWKNRTSPHGYQWPIRLAQLAIALMFVSGMFHKVWRGAPTLDWALSDNLRHHLLVHFDANGLPRTALADWMIDSAWRYKTAALGNLIAQTLPLVACFLVNRPVLRALCGVVFLTEVLALGFVMDLWNYQWLPLTVVFIDWDWLRSRGRCSDEPVLEPPPRTKRALSAFLIAFLLLDVITSFVPRLDQRLNLYPFSGFPMFASLRIRKPASEHLPYSFEGGHIEILAPTPAPEVELELDRFYDKLFRIRDRARLQPALQDILTSAKRLYPATQGVRLYWTIYEAPAYPAPARIERKPIAILGELMLDGTYRSLLATAAPGPSPQVTTYADAIPTPRPFAGETPKGRAVAYVVDDGAQRWVVFQAKR